MRALRQRPRLLSTRSHLVVLFACFVVALVAATEFQGARQLDQAREEGRVGVQFAADLAAELTAGAVADARTQVEALAANPAIPAVFETPEGCTLSFTAVPPFSGGHLDIVATDGTVVCSSRELPPPGRYAGASWLRQAAGSVTMLSTEPDSEAPVLVVVAAVGDQGVVAIFMELTGIDSALASRFGGDGEQFGVRDTDGEWLTDPLPRSGTLNGSSEVVGLDWVVEAAIPETAAVASAQRVLNQSRLVVLFSSIVLLVAVAIMNRVLVRPVRRLDADVTRAMEGEVPRPVGSSGPSEVIALAENFSTLARNVASELDQRRRAEDDARGAAASLRRLFEANPQPTWVHDRDTGEILRVNDALVALLGIERDELLGMNASQLLPPEAPPWLGALGDDEQEVARVGPLRFSAADDGIIECEVTSDVLDFDGRCSRVVIVEDVTAARRTQRMVDEMQRMDSLGQLAGGISHDFNNLLTVILNYVRLASDSLEQRNDPSVDDVCRDLDHVTVATERAAALTSQLLAFAKGEAIEMQPVDVNAVVDQVTGLLGRTLGEHIEISLHLGHGIPAVLADHAQLEQVLVNLAVNARDAMPAGGALTIETSVMELDEEERPDVSAGRYVRIRVSDTGVGMAASVRRRAFEPFFTTKARGAGTGLGLSTVYGIVVRAGGAMELYSESGHGTTIGVLLPVTEQVRRPPATTDTLEPTDGGRVLVVEDDASLRMVTERILQRAGYDVESATDGAAALDRLSAHGPRVDLVLTDAVMPGMLGIDLVREIRQHHPDVPVVMMSGHLPRTLDPSADMTQQPIALLSKPFTAADLLRFVRNGIATA